MRAKKVWRNLAVVAPGALVGLLAAGPAPAQVIEPPVLLISPGQAFSLFASHMGSGYCNRVQPEGGSAVCSVDADPVPKRIAVSAQISGVGAALADGQIYWDFQVNGQGDDLVQAQASLTVKWNGAYVVAPSINGSQAGVSFRAMMIDRQNSSAVDAVKVHENSVDSVLTLDLGAFVTEAYLDSSEYLNVVLRGLVRRGTRYRVLVQAIATAETKTAATMAALFQQDGQGLYVLRADLQIGDDKAALAAQRAAAALQSAAFAGEQAAAASQRAGAAAAESIATRSLVATEVVQPLGDLRMDALAGFSDTANRLADLSKRLAGVEDALIGLGPAEGRSDVQLDVDPRGPREFIVSSSRSGVPVPVTFLAVSTLVPEPGKRGSQLVNLLQGQNLKLTELGPGLYLLSVRNGQRLEGLRLEVENATEDGPTYKGTRWYPALAGGRSAKDIS